MAAAMPIGYADEPPRDIAQKVIAETKKEKEEAKV